MKKTFYVFRYIIVSILIMAVMVGAVSAAPYKSYIYVKKNSGITDVAAPTAYLPVKVYDENNLGVKLSAPEDICLDSEGNFYILDSETGYIHSFSPEWEKRYSLFGYL